jgi:hypothetical protein
MPFYCDKRSAGTCVVLGPKQSSTYSLGKEARLGALGVGGCNRLRLRFFSSLRPRICRRLLGLATKDYSDRLLADFDHLLNRGPISSISLFVRVSPRTSLAFQYDVCFSWPPRPSVVTMDVPR